jgi:hypothetical protein
MKIISEECVVETKLINARQLQGRDIELQKFVSDNSSISIDSANILAVKLCIYFDVVLPAREQISLAVYYFCDSGMVYGEAVLKRPLDKTDNEISFTNFRRTKDGHLARYLPEFPTEFVHKIGFACVNANLKFKIQAFDISREENGDSEDGFGNLIL